MRKYTYIVYIFFFIYTIQSKNNITMILEYNRCVHSVWIYVLIAFSLLLSSGVLIYIFYTNDFI